MANGTDSEERFVVLSKIRVGLKREFEFALKVQSEICGSLGRTRARNVQSNVESGCVVMGSPEVKKLKTYESRKKRNRGEQSIVIKETEVKSVEEANRNVVDVNNKVEKEKEGNCDSRKKDVGEKGVLMNVEEVKVKNEQRVEESNEIEKGVVQNGCSEVSMNVEEYKCEEVDHGKGGNDRTGKEKNDFEELVVGVEDEKKNGCDNVLINIEEDKHNEVDGEKGENDLTGEVKIEFEAVAGVEEKKKNESDRIAMDVEEDKREEVDQGKECEPENVVMEVDEEKKNDIGRELVENGVLERHFDGKDLNILCKGGSCVTEPAVTAGNDHGKAVNVVVERPLRRFTRSLLQQKEKLEKESSSKDGGIESDVIEVAGGGVSAPMKQDRVMRLKKVMRKFYTRLKDFLESGILEGMPVKYIRGSKVKGPGVRGLRGVVKGSGISCFCGDCEGNQVVTPTVFELHAGSSNKRPPEYIYLENGNSLRDIMNACKDSPLETLEEAVRMVVGLSIKKSSFCLNCRGSITNVGVEELLLLCKSCAKLKESQGRSAEMKESEARSAEMEESQAPSADLEGSQTPSTELTETSDRSPEPSSAQSLSHSKMKSSSLKSHGKITRKDLRMHKLVFEEGGLDDGTEVGYFVRGEKFLVGYKKGFGILCSCCNSEVSPSQFEAHAGWATRRKPFQHIYTSNGVSLHELSIRLSLQRPFSTKENDDLCGICMDGGDLLCCDSCPRAFHIDCCSLPRVPSGTWYCRYCTHMFQKEKFVEHNANARAAGRIQGVDPIAQITSRCIRIVQTPDTELGGCVLCRGRDFCKSRFGRRTVIFCDQCEREYHVGCLKDNGMEDLQELPKGKWLCCVDCKRINSALQKLVDRGEEKLPETSLDAIKKKHQQSGSDNVVDVDVRWRVLRGKKVDASDGTRALLSKAVSIFHDRFDPIIESASKLDLIPAMAYGRSRKGQDYHGMYCAILTVNQVVASAGIFRIFGQELAELPLVATSNACQGQGYFQSLFTCIEKLLAFLNVKTLVLPSASEAQTIWTNKFGFNMMTEEEQNKCRNDYPVMIFQGTAMLQKPVPKCRIVGKPVDE